MRGPVILPDGRAGLRWIAALAFCVTAAPADARAEGKEVLLPVEGKRAAARKLDKQLIAASKKLGRRVSLAKLHSDELMLAVGCAAKSVACLQKMGKLVGASSLIIASAKRSGKVVLLKLRRFDVKSGADSSRATVSLPRAAETRRAVLLVALRKLYAVVASPAPPKPTRLEITSSPPGATLMLDGRRRGVAPVILVRPPSGRYRVTARYPDHHDWHGEVLVEPGRTTKLKIELQRVAPAPPKEAGYFDSIRLNTWVVGGIGVTALTIGLAFAAHLSSQQTETDRLEGNTLAEIHELEQLRATGRRDAVVANVMFGVGLGLLVTAGVLSYFDYRRARAERREPAPAQRLSVGPSSVRVSF